MRQRALPIVSALLLAAACALIGGYFYLRLSLPRTGGEITAAGLAAPVEVLRDAHGIPHIFAQSERDAQFALGFVHAQDRLWQLEMNRRIAAGRMAEVLGPAALEADRFLRTLGIRRVAQANLAHLDGDTRQMLAAYAAGVNAFLATRPVLPPEFWIVGLIGGGRPEPWSEADSIAWGKMLAWDLGGNWRAELLRMQLAARLSTVAIQEFLPPYPGERPVELPDLGELYRGLERPPVQISSVDERTAGSNSWVVSGVLTATGKPLLANDPHLGLTAPGVWYFAHLHAPGLDAIGATLPGVPGIVLGRNDRIAWSATNTGPDVQDLYLEKLAGAGYLAPDGPRAFATHPETIRVKGARDEQIVVRASRHGPVISDVLASALEATPRGHALALAWTALAEDDTSVAAILKLGRARDWRAFVEATRELHAPQQNLSFADVDGNIGFVAPGRIPLRKRENPLQGLAPAPGWDARFDWAGFVPFEELPRAFNPASGAIVTANQKVVPPGYPHLITHEWQPPYRARRIQELLEQTKAHDRASFARIQMDVVSLAARELMPSMLQVKGMGADALTVVKILQGWDGAMAAERAEPLILTAWWRELARGLYADELGPQFRTSWGPRAVFVTNTLKSEARWCDDVRTPQRESCGDILAAALERAAADLRRRYGDDMAAWKWGDAHVARMRHRPFSRNRWLAPYFDIRVPSGGDSYTVNAGAMEFSDEAEPFANRHGASLRAIYDLADPQASVFVHPGGQSGNPLSPHYRDLAPLWARGEYVPMLTDRRRLEAAGAERLLLVPKR